MTEQAVTIYNDNNMPQVHSENLSLFERAMDKNYSIEQIEKLFELQKRHEENEARKAYHLDMALFKKVKIEIPKDKINTQYNSRYTSLGILLEKVVPILAEHHFSHRWDIKQAGNEIKVNCIATHEKGHQESVEMVAPPDESGSKNPIQRIKSTRTYLQSATFESLFGLAATDANVDDDGNGHSNAPKKDLSKMSHEYKTLMQTKEMFGELYEEAIKHFGSEPDNKIKYQQVNDWIHQRVAEQDNQDQ